MRLVELTSASGEVLTSASGEPLLGTWAALRIDGAPVGVLLNKVQYTTARFEDGARTLSGRLSYVQLAGSRVTLDAETTPLEPADVQRLLDADGQIVNAGGWLLSMAGTESADWLLRATVGQTWTVGPLATVLLHLEEV